MSIITADSVVMCLLYDPRRGVCRLITATVWWTSPRIDLSRLAGVRLWTVITLQTQL